MVSSFVVQEDAMQVAIVFSAEAYVDDGSAANRRMFVRALIDGQFAAPSNVVFATVWHVVSDAADNALAPRGLTNMVRQQMDQTQPRPQPRRGLRLLKRFASYNAGTGEATAVKQLWGPFGSDLLSGKCDSAFPDNFASWEDCGASGYSLRFLTPPANTRQVQIKVP